MIPDLKRTREESAEQMDRNKVLLGFSGGVDSTAAAVILRAKGLEVTGLYFDVLEGGDPESREYAEKTAEKLGMDLIAVNVSESFEKLVIQPFLSLYEAGRTPIPCVMCNPAVKFAVLKEYADKIGTYYIATGHYARILEGAGAYKVRKAVNLQKDQSYMLCRLPQEILSRLILPIGDFASKEEIREICRDMDLPNSGRKDSQDICFIKNMTTQEYLKSNGIQGTPGNFVKTDGSIVKAHEGTANYTIGQRKGLGVALGAPAFVKSIDAKSGDIVLCTNEELFESSLTAEDCIWQWGRPETGKTYMCKPRYTAKEAACKVTALEGEEGRIAVIEFEEPQRAITPGQAAVLYDGEIVVGGGYIAYKAK